jgi:hypothetical protein
VSANIWLTGVTIVYSNKPMRSKKMRLDDEDRGVPDGRC